MWFFLKGSRRFREEIDTWVVSGLIAPAQAERLIEHYDLDREAPWYTSSSFILKSIAMLLGAMGLLLIISVNWNEFSVPVRMIIGLLPLFIAYGFAIRAALRENSQGAELAMIFGTLAFGINIALQAQIFHIEAYYPDGILWWIIGAMPVIFYFRSTLLAVVFQCLFIMWLSMQNTYGQFSLFSPVLMAAFVGLLYRQPNGVTVLFTFTSFFTFLSNIIIAFEDSFSDHIFEMTPLFFGSYVLLFLVLFQFIRPQYSELFAERLQSLLLAVILFFLYLLTFKDVAGFMIGKIAGYGIPVSLYLMLTAAIVVFMIQRGFRNISLLLGLLAVCLFFMPVVFFPNAGSYKEAEGMASVDSFAFVYALLTNALFLGYAIWKIREGIQKRQKQKFMIGIFLLVVLAISRYVNLIDNYLLTALIFMGCAVMIYYINNLWDKKYAK